MRGEGDGGGRISSDSALSIHESTDMGTVTNWVDFPQQDANGNELLESSPNAGIWDNRISESLKYTYEYDNEGNVIRKTPKSLENPYIEEYGWDHKGRL